MQRPVTLEELPQHLESIPKSSWDQLFTFIPRITEATSFGEWKTIGHSLNFMSTELVDEFIKIVYEMGLIVDFAWMQWDEGCDLIQDNETDYLNLSSIMLIKLLTTITRADRFSEGALGGAFKDGKILKILRGLEKYF
jgi:hypothetical protein